MNKNKQCQLGNRKMEDTKGGWRIRREKIEQGQEIRGWRKMSGEGKKN